MTKKGGEMLCGKDVLGNGMGVVVFVALVVLAVVVSTFVSMLAEEADVGEEVVADDVQTSFHQGLEQS